MIEPATSTTQLKAISFLSNGTSGNSKTGNVPQIMIGATREESIRSCQSVKCPLLHRKHGGQGGQPLNISRKKAQELHLVNPVCYSQSGTGAIAHASSCHKAERTAGTDKSNEGMLGLLLALKSRVHSAKIVRLGTIGDPAALSRDVLFNIFSIVEAAGLKLIGYTHGWQTNSGSPSVEFMKRRVMASCDTLEQADEAIRLGWQVAVTLPADTPVDAKPKTPGGLTVLLCPAMTTKARYRILTRKRDAVGLSTEEQRTLDNLPVVTCNTCKLCSGDKKDIIGFPFHDNANQHTIWRD